MYKGVPTQNIQDGCVGDYRPDVDYFPDKVTPEYARIFSVSYHKNYKVVRLRSEQKVPGYEPVADTMVLVQCGTPVPALSGELAGAAVISIPVMSIAANDNCDIAAIYELRMSDRLVAIGGSHIYNERLRRLAQQGKLPSIGYAWHGLPNVEFLLANPADVLFMRRASLDQGRAVTRARNLGIKTAPTLARAEKHYLGFAEWIRYFALFLNAERNATDLFHGVAGRAREIAARARSLPNKPGVVWAGYRAGAWVAARSPLDLRSQYLEDAGAINLLTAPNALPDGAITNEELLARASEAQYWISENQSNEGWPQERFLNRIRAYTTDQVYHHEKRSVLEEAAYDWYETGAMRPDLVLQDLAAIFHPEIEPAHEVMFFERIARK